MKKNKLRLIMAVVFTSLLCQVAFGAATVKVKAISCVGNSSADDLGFVFGGHYTYRYDVGTVSGPPGDYTMENLDASKCNATDITTELTTLAATCSTYFDVISVTPIIRGNYAGVADDSVTGSKGWGYGFGFSYTSRILIFYRCQ